jgi:hypothetical protein
MNEVRISVGSMYFLRCHIRNAFGGSLNFLHNLGGTEIKTKLTACLLGMIPRMYADLCVLLYPVSFHFTD